MMKDISFHVVQVVFMSAVILTMAQTPEEVYVGVLLGQGSENDIWALHLAVDYINSQPDILPDTQIKLILARQSHMLSNFEYITNACWLVEQGVQIIIGPETSEAVKAIATVTESLHLPQIAPFATDSTLSLSSLDYPYLLKLSAPDTYQARAIADLTNHFGWSKYAIIASLGDYGRNGVQDFQSLAADNDWIISSMVYFYPEKDPKDINLERQLIEIKSDGVRIVILWCLAFQAQVILDQARVRGMTTSEWVWIVTDGVTLFPNQLYPRCTTVPEHIQGLLGTRPVSARGHLFDQFQERWRDAVANGIINVTAQMPTACDNVERDQYMENDLAAWASVKRSFDAMSVAAYGFHDYLMSGHNLTRTMFGQDVCSSSKPIPAWSDGHLLMEYLSRVDGPGVSQHLSFNELRFLEPAEFSIVNAQTDGLSEVAFWSQYSTPHLDFSFNSSIQFMGGGTTPPRDVTLDLRNTVFRVVTIIEEPYAMPTTADERKMNPTVLYKGFCIDLMHKLSEDLGFVPILHVVYDGNYGGKMIRNDTEVWNGIVGELVYNEADIAIASLTITYERQHVIDFTTPYQDMGLGILIAKDAPVNSIWAFLEPFEWQLWYAVGAAFVTCAVMTSICSYLSPFGYRGGYVQRRNDHDQSKRDKRNNLSLFDSLWYSFASWMQQGQEVSPQCFSGRFVHGFWWFAVMVITATYTANLAAFLTVERLVQGINSASDLANQNEIKYGTVVNSAPVDYFYAAESDPYRTMGEYMQAYGTNSHTTAAGIERVKESYGKPKSEQYAFIFDSSPLEFAANQEPCNMVLVEKLFNNFGYGLALRKNSPFTSIFNIQLLTYRQNGYLDVLSSKYFGGTCNLEEDSGTATKGETATFESMMGVFLLMAIGLGASIIALIFECVVAAYRDRNFFKRTKDGPQGFMSCLGRRVRLVLHDMHEFYCTCTCSCLGNNQPVGDEAVRDTSETNGHATSPTVNPGTGGQPSAAIQRRRDDNSRPNINETRF